MPSSLVIPGLLLICGENEPLRQADSPCLTINGELFSRNHVLANGIIGTGLVQL